MVSPNAKIILLTVFVVAGIAWTTQQGRAAAQQAPADRTGNLILYGDMAIFLGLGEPENCVLRSRYKRGDPVGFRMSAIDPETGEHVEPEAELIVHLNYGGRTEDLRMRWRATEQQPERTFWVAKWVVPDDAPTGIVRYTVTARDRYGRTGEFEPYRVEASQLTIVD